MKKKAGQKLRAVELFTGAGGLAVGVSQAGFSHTTMIEMNSEACGTVRLNRKLGVRPIDEWPDVFEGDVREFNFSSVKGPVDLVAGGPPCQPFSLGGKHGAYNDRRDMWSEAIRAVRELEPRAFIFENVRGLVRQSFSAYFNYILLRLSYPDLAMKPQEAWQNHLSRLERSSSHDSSDKFHYQLQYRVLNACDYGVPQRRPRVFIVGFRSDLGIDWQFPEPTHSREALLYDQWITGDYWERHNVSKRSRPEPRCFITSSLPGLIEKQPWRTVRDAISSLPTPSKKKNSLQDDHCVNPGARIYPGHTGSPLDEPAKTLKAGDHGVPGGENMLLYPDGRVRYFTVRESARLQTFSDDFRFCGSWTECMRQIGNAVPVTLGEIVAKSVASKLNEFDGRDLRPSTLR